MKQVLVDVKEECIQLNPDGSKTLFYEPRPHLNYTVQANVISEAVAISRATFKERHGDRHTVLSCAPMSKEKISFIYRSTSAPKMIKPPGWTHRKPPKSR